MLEAAPHILQIEVQATKRDKYNRLLPSTNQWQNIGECFCHDSGAIHKVSINGQMFDFNYHVVYEGEKIAVGKIIRCLLGDKVIGEGKVIKSSECYTAEFKGRCDLWI